MAKISEMYGIMLKKRGIKSILKHIFLKPYAMLIRLFPFSPMRIFLLKIMGAKIPFSAYVQDVNIMGMDIGTFKNLIAGDYVHIGEDSLIDLYDRVYLEEHSIISPRAMIFTHQSAGIYSPMSKYYPEKRAPVVVKRGAWIGAGSIILSGVIVGEMSIVSAGSVVLKDVPPYSVVAGVPAKVVKKLPKSK